MPCCLSGDDRNITYANRRTTTYLRRISTSLACDNDPYRPVPWKRPNVQTHAVGFVCQYPLFSLPVPLIKESIACRNVMYSLKVIQAALGILHRSLIVQLAAARVSYSAILDIVGIFVHRIQPVAAPRRPSVVRRTYKNVVCWEAKNQTQN